MNNFPRIELQGDSAVVTRWGHAGDVLLRPGDRLVLSDGGAGGHGVVLLVPRGFGRPMLAVRRGAALVALESGAPASPMRWSVHGTVVAIERDMARGGPGPGDWHVDVHGGAAADLRGGVMDGHELDLLCARAAVHARRTGAAIAIVASPEAGGDAHVAPAPGLLRFALAEAPPQAHGGASNVVPFPCRPAVSSVRRQLGLFADRQSA